VLTELEKAGSLPFCPPPISVLSIWGAVKSSCRWSASGSTYNIEMVTKPSNTQKMVVVKQTNEQQQKQKNMD